MISNIQIKRYAWVVELLMRRRKLGISEINKEWLRSPLSENERETPNRKTWYKCFDDIGMIYGIIIETTPRNDGAKWHIVNREALEGRNIENWMLSCVAHRNLLEECMGMYNRTDIEGFPSENGMLEPITHAMKDNRKIEVWYQRYGRSEQKSYIVEPYFIKTYNHRFYVLCKFDTGFFYTLSFDRMLQVVVLKEKFNFPKNLFAEDFFEDSFGVMMPNNGEEAQDIIVRAKGDAAYYLEDVPLHKSQRILKEGKDYVDFLLHLRVTNDFIGAILQQGNRLEVMSPKKVRERVKECLLQALMPYQES